ncbi:beta-lactamase family protein [Elizabethkingia anophelis]|uniref:serine hydrolase domain-containing protein n=1 Tax=Elizabethkingia anophelis TaxID=1117645 RepID=UPI0021A2D94E|nr:beta-lactamase family protein [Elizabethkingia anophelis]MCT3976512.1 beta-lactamase family protein [Elizabethkingia anophelis]MCT4040113.1 beta-lactamase family protein [Elizabethkingia anophelis]MCT4171671.1 beta-lactamase family protein [Elizabethkingia anophelis]MCT4175663.1 beta-lactamase family protein [Elizabethkingia anophelis]
MKLHLKPALSIFLVATFGLFFGQSDLKNKIRKTDSLMYSYYKPDAPGMALGIIKDGQIIYRKTTGLSNIEYKIPVTDSTLFNIASGSKQFTAFMALRAEQEGKLSMDNDIKTYLPELKHLPYKITVRQLANHTHGLPNFTDILKLQGIGDEVWLTNSEAIHTVLSIKNIVFPSGQQYQYNNTGFMLLAEILQRVYKKDFAQLVKEYIFNPLRMDNSIVFGDPEKNIPNRSESYRQKDGSFLKSPVGQAEYGSSNIYTSLNDYCKWAANFQNPTVGNREAYDQMQKNTLQNINKEVQYGLGLQSEKYKGLDIVFHGGGTSGYRSYILHVPSQKFSVVFLSNRSGFEGLLMAYQLVDLYLGDKETVSTPPRKMTYTSAELKKFEGTYELSPGYYIEVSEKDKQLYWGLYNETGREELKIAGDDKFRITNIPTAYLTFKPEQVNFRIADFTYICKRVKLNPPKAESVNLNKFTGFYRNEEFNTIYQLVVENNHLVAKHTINEDLILFPISQTSFSSRKQYFGKIDFKADEKGNIEEFSLSGAGLANIEFKKIK